MYVIVMQVGQAELVSLEKVLKEAMVPAGAAREVCPLASITPPPNFPQKGQNKGIFFCFMGKDPLRFFFVGLL